MSTDFSHGILQLFRLENSGSTNWMCEKLLGMLTDAIKGRQNSYTYFGVLKIFESIVSVTNILSYKLRF